MNRKQNASRRAAQITRTLRRLFPEAEEQYERECVTTRVFRLTDWTYVLRVTWERLDTRESVMVLDRLKAIVAGDEHAYIDRYSRFDADVVVNDLQPTEEEPEKTGDQVAAEARLADAEAAYVAARPPLPPYQEEGEVEVLLTPDIILGMLDGTRFGAEEINGKRAYVRMITAEEYIAWMHREKARAEVEGRYFPEQPYGWENDMRRKLAPLPTEAVNRLLNPTRRPF